MEENHEKAFPLGLLQLRNRSVARTACFLAMASLIGIAQTIPPLLPPAANFSFPDKQTLTYAVDWRVFPAGTATFHLEQVGAMQHLSLIHI